MKFKIIAPGKLKEAYLREGIDEYLKRMKAFGGLEIIGLADERIPDNPSENEKQKIKEVEGQKILEKLSRDEKVIVLTLDGKLLNSEELAKKISDWELYGNSKLTFIIGGSLGLSEAVIKRADLKLSFGRMTFPHQLMRLILVEQIYRSAMINQGSSYHK
ncbi:MAG: 23S rRNA (pseudouridine(1915)-N(3))-methyltransferase RlmH [Lactovum sp.]